MAEILGCRHPPTMMNAPHIVMNPECSVMNLESRNPIAQKPNTTKSGDQGDQSRDPARNQAWPKITPPANSSSSGLVYAVAKGLPKGPNSFPMTTRDPSVAASPG